MMMQCQLLLFSLAVGGYTYLRTIAPLQWSTGWKLVAASGLAVVALRLSVLTLLRGDSLYAPELPAWVNTGYACLFVALVMWFCAIFAGHVVRQTLLRAVAAWRNSSPETQQKLYNRLHAALLAVALVLSSLAAWGGLREPVVQELSLRCGLAQPLRIALLTDLHVSTLCEPGMLRNIVERTNELGADVVCITGDFVDGSVAECAEHMEPLRELKAPLGVYGVAGNHDYYSGYEEWRAFLTEHGVRMLDNEHVVLPCGVALAGVTEQTAAKLAGMESPDVAKALRGLPAGVPVILLSHRPGVAAEAAERGVAVQLSGHTHGGLVWGVGQLVALMNKGFVAGLYKVGAMQLYVSPGTSTGSRTPLRLGTRAEITSIKLL